MKLSQRFHERCACAGAAAAPFVLSGTERKYERARQFHVRHLFLDLEVDFEQKAVSGVAVLDVERVAPDADRLSLDAIGFELASVRIQERQGEDAADGDRDYTDAEYEYDGETLQIAGLSGHERARLEIRYRAEPRRGLYFLEPDAKVKDRPVQVWSQCQDEDARHWFPCHDKPHVKMTTELRVRVPAGFVALSNGDPVGEEVTQSAARAPAKRKKAADEARDKGRAGKAGAGKASTGKAGAGKAGAGKAGAGKAGAGAGKAGAGKVGAGKVGAGKAGAGKAGGRDDSAFEYFHFKLDRPHPSYLVTLVIGKFAIVEDRDAQLPNNRRIPVRYYVPQSRREDALRSFGETPRMLELFSKLTGTPYPFSRYTQVVVSDFIFGGMENTTATTMYEHALLDKRAALDISSTDIVAHELAHQWFGDFVTCRDWSQAWLNEGFATYFEHVERADRLGRDEYDYSIQGDLETYLGEAASRYQRPIVCRDYQEPIDLFDRHLYEKGGLVLHMLRRRLGDELFWRGVRVYLSGHAHGIVETNDLQRAFESVSGDSLDEFFDQWVYRPGHPELKVKVGYEDGLLTASVKQAQKTGEVATFAFDFEIEVREKGGKVTRHRKRVSSTQDALVLPLAARPEYVAFDPELRVLGAITFDAPNDMLRRQLEHGSSAVLRWTAAEALAKKSDPATISALARALENEEESWMVRAEAARALGRTRAEKALEVLIAQARTDHPKVRRAVVAGLGVFRDPRAVAAVRPLASKDPSYVVESEAARALGKTREKAALAPILSMIDRASWGDVIRIGVFDGLSALRDDSALDQVLAHTQYGFPTRGRRSAIAALAHLGEGRRTREALELLLDDRDPHVRLEVISALLTLGDVKCRPALRRALERELDGRVARRIREALRDLGDTNTERKRLADDLETLRGELAELKARFSKLEVKHGAKHGEDSPGDAPARKKKGKKRA